MGSGKIFINYRRDDSGGYAGRLYDRLKARFPHKVFMDVGGIKYGEDFVQKIEREVGDCEICLAIIGKGWLNATDAGGQRRLDDAGDYVRLEIGAALQRQVGVIPVLVGGAAMPTEKELPAELQPLARRNALQISDQDWDHHVDVLIRTIESTLGVSSQAHSPAGGWAAWRRANTLWLAGILAAIALVAAAVYLSRKPRTGSHVNEPLGTDRRSVAVLGFKNISGRPEKDYLSTALSEMLTTELQAGRDLRVIPQNRVSRIEQDLALTDVSNLSRDWMDRLRNDLGADLLIHGTYAFQGGSSAGLHVEFRVEDASARQAPISVSSDGDEADLFALVSGAAGTLRNKLAMAQVAESQEASVKASFPSNPEAIRLYSEALEKLRTFDLATARDRLQHAIELEPNFALAHSALAETYQMLGYDAKAQAEAKAGFDLSYQLIPEQRNLVEGRYREIYSDWADAIKIYSSLWTALRDIEYGLLLAQTQISAGQGKDALVTVENLRKLPSPTNRDPRIDLTAAKALDAISDFKQGAPAAGEAAQAATKQGARFLASQALLEQCWAYYNLTEPAQAKTACEKAQDISADVGDLLSRARSLTRISRIAADQGLTDQALELRNRALNIARQVGSKKDISGALLNIGDLQSSLGNLDAAQKSYQEALSVAREIDFKKDMVDVENSLGTLYQAQCEYELAKETYERSRQAAEATDDKDAQAKAIYNLGSVLFLLGDLKLALADIQKAIETSKGIGHKNDTANMLFTQGDIMLAEDDLPAAEKCYREAAEFLEPNNQSGLAVSRLEMAQLQLERGQAAEAAKLAQQAATEFANERDLGDESGAQELLGRALIAMGNFVDAQHALDRAVELAPKDCAIRLPLAITRARLLALTQQSTAASRIIDQVQRESKAKSLDAFAMEAQLAQGEIEMASGKSQPARAHLRTVEALATQKHFLLIARKARTLAQTGKPAKGGG